MKISKDMTIIDILQKYPDAVAVFNKFNMGCFSCAGAQNETLYKGCVMHGLDADAVVLELNKAAK